MSGKTELLPCPFCGGEAEAVHEISGFWTVECVKCGALVDGIAAWNTRAEHGTLTAEQVKRIHEIIEKHWHDLSAEYDMPEATALPEYSYDWQAIADELNARAERTCECVAEYAKSPIDGKTIVLHRCSACNELMRPHMNYCPSCGGEVREKAGNK